MTKLKTLRIGLVASLIATLFAVLGHTRSATTEQLSESAFSGSLNHPAIQYGDRARTDRETWVSPKTAFRARSQTQIILEHFFSMTRSWLDMCVARQFSNSRHTMLNRAYLFTPSIKLHKPPLRLCDVIPASVATSHSIAWTCLDSSCAAHSSHPTVGHCRSLAAILSITEARWISVGG